MRVMCINENWQIPNGWAVEYPKFGGEYTVIDQDRHPDTGRMGYMLDEVSHNIYWRYDYFVEINSKIENLQLEYEAKN